MTNEQSRIGKVVVLLSGGPKMTVKAENIEAETLTCIWFDAGNNLQEFTFHRDAVTSDHTLKDLAEGLIM